MININSFIKQLAYYFPSQIYPSIMNLIIIMILARELSLGDFGNYNLFIIVVSFGCTIVTQWFIQSILFYRPQYEKENRIREFNFHYNKGIFYFFIFFIIIAIIMSGLYICNIKMNYSLIILFSIFVQSIFNLEQVILQSKLDYKKYALKSFLVTTIRFLFIIFILSFIGPNVELILIAIAISYSLFILNKVKEYLMKEKLELAESTKDFYIKMLVYGTPLLGWFLCTSFMHLSDRILIKFFHDAEEMALYSGNYSIISAGLGLIFVPLNTVLQPIIMKKAAENTFKVEELESLIKKMTTIYLIIGIPAILLIDSLKEEIVFLLLGEKYVVGSGTITYLMIGMLLWSISMIGQKGMEINKQTNKMFYFILIITIVNFLVNIILVRYWSYLGAALGNLIAFSLYCLLVYWNSKKNIKWLFDWKAVTILLLTVAPLIFCIDFIIEFLLKDFNSIIIILVNSVLFLSIYSGLIYSLLKYKKINIKF